MNKKVGILRAKRRNSRIQLPDNVISVVRVEDESGNIPFDGYMYWGATGSFYYSGEAPCIVNHGEVRFVQSFSKFFFFRWFQRLYDIIFPKTYLITYFYKKEDPLKELISTAKQCLTKIYETN